MMLPSVGKILSAGRRGAERVEELGRDMVRQVQSRRETHRRALVSAQREFGSRYGSIPLGETSSFVEAKNGVLRVARRAIGHFEPEVALELTRFVQSLVLRDRDSHLVQALALKEVGDESAALMSYLEAYPLGKRSERRRAGKLWLERQNHLLPFLGEWVGSDVLTSQALDDTEVLRRLLADLLAGILNEVPLCPRFDERLYARLLARQPAFKEPLDDATKGELVEIQAVLGRTEFAAARIRLREIVASKSSLHPKVLRLLARAEAAESLYDQALSALRLATWTRADRLESWKTAARLRWILHDYESAAVLARQVLKVEANDIRTRTLLTQCEHPLTPPAPAPTDEGRRYAHVAFHALTGGNFGDISLPDAVRHVFELDGNVAWTKIHVHQVLDRRRLEYINSTQGVIIGGGGLFLPDTSPNGVSGWQWNASCEAIEAIRVPIAVFAVGYNLFRGQAFRRGLFERSLRSLAERAMFVGLRNNGSLEQARRYLTPELGDKLCFVPCPTTVLSRIDPALHPDVAPTRPQGRVVLNMAYDRQALRFGDSYDRFLESLALYIGRLRRDGCEVIYAAHLPADNRFVEDIRAGHSIDLSCTNLHDLSLKEAYAFYQSASLVVGMRGHATMIPFGLRTPVLSLISHPKMRYFLEDIGRLEWGVDVEEKDLESILWEKSRWLLDHQVQVQLEIDAIQSSLLQSILAQSRRFSHS